MINIEKRDKINIVTFKTDTINALITDEIRDQIIKIFEASNSKVIIDYTKSKSISFDVIELINDFEQNALTKNIQVEKIIDPTQSFK